jgi:hypothetical protein
LKSKEKQTVNAIDPAGQPGLLKRIGGSQSDTWNNLIVGQAVQTLWTKNSDTDERNRQYEGTISALIAISPQDEIEGMIATQLIAAHNAAMESYRRAMIGEQTLEGRRENLNQANKLSRTYSTLLEALNRHRGKGQQKVTVEHVHVYQGGQAIVGNLAGEGEGIHSNRRNNLMHLDMHLARRCGARTRSGSPCRSPAMTNGRCRMHGGPSTGAPKGNKNAFRHGRYSAATIARRRATFCVNSFCSWTGLTIRWLGVDGRNRLSIDQLLWTPWHINYPYSPVSCARSR